MLYLPRVNCLSKSCGDCFFVATVFLLLLFGFLVDRLVELGVRHTEPGVLCVPILIEFRLGV